MADTWYEVDSSPRHRIHVPEPWPIIADDFNPAYPVERDDLASDLFRDWMEAGEYADPAEVATRAFDAADAFMAEMMRRNTAPDPRG